MEQVLPGVLHWTALHPRHRIVVSSYYLEPQRVLIDPMAPEGGIGWFADHGPPAEILLTNRHHYRASGEFAAAYGCIVRCHRAGLHEFTHGERVDAFEFGDELPGGVIARELGAICPEETALQIPAASAMAFADGLVRFGDGPLGFVPDALLGDDPEAVKAELRAALARLLAYDFEHLLLAHGGPVVGGRAALERFLADG